ncbi:hypothetical protein BV25DRAFT_1522032 [Artomyces pyxidatus]|uniref:Uncharacterized protein n=1 Tax=Artomyces pyxidatus TaxID=48021 RepID=A0ACB8TD41_9AGAM|nr:hypothetical protein BV25DRAFT_1522032 [Artomyces pyxidatus]
MIAVQYIKTAFSGMQTSDPLLPEAITPSDPRKLSRLSSLTAMSSKLTAPLLRLARVTRQNGDNASGHDSEPASAAGSDSDSSSPAPALGHDLLRVYLTDTGNPLLNHLDALFDSGPSGSVDDESYITAEEDSASSECYSTAEEDNISFEDVLSTSQNVSVGKRAQSPDSLSGPCHPYRP